MALQEARDLATPKLHSMFGLRRRRPRAAATTEFGTALDTLGLPQNRVAKLFGVSCRHIRRWQHGDRTVPRAVRLVINLLVAGAISIDQVEQAAAVSAPARTNGHAEPEPPARLRDEPEPKPPAPLCIEPAPAPVPVCELTSAVCHWPVGDPRQSNFRFCSAPVVTPPYCQAHRARAYLRRPLLLEARPAVTYGFRPGRRLLSSSGIEAPRQGDQDEARIL
jgi:hypothetical protein